MTYSIYKITSPSGKIYIGQTMNIKRRFNEYKRYQRSQFIISNSIQKYGYNNHTFVVLYTGLTKEEANFHEIELIKVNKILKISMNICAGGNLLADLLKKVVLQFDLTGKLLQEFESVRLANDYLKVETANISHCIKSKNYYCKGYLWIYKDDYLKGIVPIWKSKNISPSIKKKVYQFNLQGVLLNSFNSLSEASDKTNIPMSTISHNLRKKNNKTYNFIFSYYDKVDRYIFIRGKYRGVICLNKITNIITEYDNGKIASKVLQMSYRKFSKIITGRTKNSDYQLKYKI